MLLKVIKRLVGGGARPAAPNAVPAEDLLEKGTEMLLAGDTRGAIKVLREYLLVDPYNVRALNDLGACLAEIGDIDNAVKMFELAHSLDDGFIPALVNHAKLLNDYHRAAEALAHLRRAKVVQPGFHHVDGVYAGLLLKIGETAKARAHQQKAWLGNFDNLRAANSHLFWISYDDVDDAQMAIEHRFWAETLKPLPENPEGPPVPQPKPLEPGRRIRLGYWSSDLRNHSVRYFFRPLLEGHDRQRFELFLFHDFPFRDHQTEKMVPFADHFHDVHEMTDAQLRDFIRSHDLDLLVDLSGHTSHNRASLLQYRMAPVQMHALGYPPTMGLPAVDAKLVDRHVLTADAGRYYAERPVALPSSFWCYDPMEEAPVAKEPPCVAKGHVTFGLVGNISKMTARLAGTWCRILEAVPGSRLLVRSVSFQDPMAIDATRDRLAAWGLPMDRVDLRSPEGGQAFFTSYNEIDVILDTYPFNGGTTTCFCTYMGVPIVSMVGPSLISRMGLSILSNLGAEDLAVPDEEAYVARAVALAGDREYLRRFKREARAKYQSTPLGNGKLFAAEFEQACIELLQERLRGPLERDSRVPALPAGELVRRSFNAMRTNQPEAAQRILAHCLREYPDAGEAHLLHAQLLVWGGLYGDAIAYVRQRVERFAPAEQASAWLSMARMHLLQRDLPGARGALARLSGLPVDDAFDRSQLALYGACVADDQSVAPGPAAPASAAARRLHVLVPCDSRPQFEILSQHLQEHVACPAGWSLSFERCDENERVPAYERALQAGGADVLVIAQKNVRISDPRFVEKVAAALERADCVSCAGARRWSRLDWRTDDFAQKAGGFITRSSENRDLQELHVMGPGREAFADGMAILDGMLLALRPGAVPAPAFDEELLGCETLLEEAWSHAAAAQGWRLAVHRHLGVSLEPEVELDRSNRVEARLRCNEQQGFDPFAFIREDHASLSTPVPDVATALATCDRFLAAGA